jgi:uncharacterized damage-inducible protein DinB
MVVNHARHHALEAVTTRCRRWAITTLLHTAQTHQEVKMAIASRILVIGTVGLLFTSSPRLTAEQRLPELIQQLEARWTASSDYTRAIAEQMPADKYQFKPTPEQMTFAEQLLHVAEQNRLILSELSGRTSSAPPPPIAAKDEVLARVDEAKAMGLRVLRDTDGWLGERLDIVNGMMLALDHTTHHRGQLIVYLRLNGITPVEYRR